ncbi:hypothetical protein ABEP00_17065 [Heyndrickxia sporothermodurans]|uniref:hypothetical protein n=1 Tax=Heyndrickxia sporothermodurans TaxID=46224 RepID=UPI003D19071F
MNLFEIDIQSVFDMASQTILVNDTKRQAIVTTPPLKENEERFIHTLDIVHMGDLVTIDDDKYISLTESVTKRHSKYKAKIRHCNYVIKMPGEVIEDFKRDENGELILDRYGDPIPITIVGESVFIPCIIENKSFSIDGYQLLVADNTIIVIAQDNEVNRVKFTVNNTFSLMDYNWKVRNQDRTKKGLLILTCERV